MPLIEQGQAHTYQVGEEVVVRLDAGGLFEVSEGDMAVVALPQWTIGEIVSRHLMNAVPQYRLAFAWQDATYLCTVAESAIEGTA